MICGKFELVVNGASNFYSFFLYTLNLVHTTVMDEDEELESAMLTISPSKILSESSKSIVITLAGRLNR